MPRPARRLRSTPERSLRLKPADPFELIRWLARSQSDPRKAVAELVQNSLDAGARRITIERVRQRGSLCLVIRDDGEGVLPEEEREAALSYLATHVGRSRKLGIDPVERTRRVIAGKYGVGLLGFWSIGRWLELRSRVAGSPLWALRLEEDSPEAALLRVPLRTDDPETFTEAAVLDVHPAAQKALGGRRLCDYLAAELRGQLLRSGVAIEIHDRVARGLAQKDFVVAPVRFAGERLALPAEAAVPGYPSLRVELYVARGAERPAIQVAALGSLVAEDIAELSALGLAERPWVGCELSGLLDFGGFNVPPGTRRGVVPDAAAQAFVAALAELRPLVEAELARLEAERRAAADRDVVRELKRALRGFRRRLPQYDLPHVAGSEVEDGSPDEGETVAEGSAGSARPRAVALFPAGPLAAVRIVPPQVTVAPGGERRVRAVAEDGDGWPIAPDDVELAWSVVPGSAGVTLGGGGWRPALRAMPRTPAGTSVELRLAAEQYGRRAEAAATVQVEEPVEDERAGLGIPEPQLVSDAEGRWRSRMVGDRWEVNDAHEDYHALRGEPRSRVRYLLTLLAREIVLRTSGRPEAADVLDSLVEVLAHAERNLRGA